ncbi:MAG: arginase family protein [Candidatus Thorarchaeota archaeon]
MANTPIEVGIAKLTQSGDYILDSLVEGPDAIEQAGLMEVLEKNGCVVRESKIAELTSEERMEYGTRHLLGLASRHLSHIVADQQRQNLFTIGLLPTCSGLMGMLAGFQMAGLDRKALRVGLVWLDAHGDINTPETSLSGLLAGMPVAVATGMCLERLRLKCGLKEALPIDYVIMLGVRDTDSLEQEIINTNEIRQITVNEIRECRPIIEKEMNRLGDLTDRIYVHLDLDVLDPREVPGHGLTAEGGPTSQELGNVLEVIFRNSRARGLGIAGYPVGKDPNGITMRAIHHLVEATINGLKHQSALR